MNVVTLLWLCRIGLGAFDNPYRDATTEKIREYLGKVRLHSDLFDSARLNSGALSSFYQELHCKL